MILSRLLHVKYVGSGIQGSIATKTLEHVLHAVRWSIRSVIVLGRSELVIDDRFIFNYVFHLRLGTFLLFFVMFLKFLI